jgi:membrane associated rhomboid family serine protease
LIEISTGSNFATYGVYPLDLKGLRGILFSPLIHGSWEHLINNSFPILVLTLTLLYFYRQISFKVFMLIYFIHTFWLWFFARESFHIGASGLIYGLGTFIFVSGIIRRNVHLLAISLMVAFQYGSMVWGIFPYEESVSWEGHLTGMAAGIFLAFFYKNYGPPSNLGHWKYELPEEYHDEEDLEDEKDPYWKIPDDMDEKDRRLIE